MAKRLGLGDECDRGIESVCSNVSTIAIESSHDADQLLGLELAALGLGSVRNSFNRGLCGHDRHGCFASE